MGPFKLFSFIMEVDCVERFIFENCKFYVENIIVNGHTHKALRLATVCWMDSPN